MSVAAVDLDGQYRLLREGAGVLDRSGRGKITVTGADAAEYLQGQLTNDIEALDPGHGCYSALLDRKGRMQADMRVLALEGGGVWIDTEAIAAAAVIRHLEMFKIGREVELADVGDARAIVSLIGPAAGEFAGAPPLRPENAHSTYERDGIEVVAVATDSGVDLLCDSAQAPALIHALESAGAPHVSEEAAEIVRVESGRPRFGREMSDSTIPEEAGINERAVSFTKGCYIGQETVARLHYKGKPNRHLRGLTLEDRASSGDTVATEDRDLGRVGTAVLSPAHGDIALAILRREAQPGDRVVVGERTAGTVVALPFAALPQDG